MPTRQKIDRFELLTRKDEGYNAQVSNERQGELGDRLPHYSGGVVVLLLLLITPAQAPSRQGASVS
jgi:hypothetical protein